jgi:uncharacterized DUF497 family protein
MATRFAWDEHKARANVLKHGLEFEDAVLAFADPFAVTEQDRIEGGELRWQTLGVICGQLVVMVAHSVRNGDADTEVIRIISARRADRKERRRYEQAYYA